MIEVEAKYRVTAETATQVAELAQASDPVREIDEVFLLSTDNWDDFSPGQPVIRLRLAGPDVTLTVKAAIDGTAAAEAEVEVAGLTQARETISLLGATPVSTVRKYRRKGQFSGINVCIDEVDDLGDFIELEVVVKDPADHAAALERLAVARERLGLVGSDPETERYDTLLAKLAKQAEPTQSQPPHTPHSGAHTAPPDAKNSTIGRHRAYAGR